MMREREGGTRSRFTNNSVGWVSVERGERAGYRSVNCWSGSMASSESAVWMELEPAGWSMRVLGPHRACGCGVDYMG
jgi:hypothetical protein